MAKTGKDTTCLSSTPGTGGLIKEVKSRRFIYISSINIYNYCCYIYEIKLLARVSDGTTSRRERQSKKTWIVWLLLERGSLHGPSGLTLTLILTLPKCSFKASLQCITSKQALLFLLTTTAHQLRWRKTLY